MILKMFERFIKKKQSFHVIAKTLTNYDNSFNKNKCIINSKKDQKKISKINGRVKKSQLEKSKKQLENFVFVSSRRSLIV